MFNQNIAGFLMVGYIILPVNKTSFLALRFKMDTNSLERSPKLKGWEGTKNRIHDQ